MKPLVTVGLLLLAAGPWSSFGKLTPEQLAALPPGSQPAVNFATDIKPILEASCIKCHGRGRAKGDFQIDNRETFLKGGSSGPAVIPGNSAESLLIELVMAFDPDSAMPKKGTRLTRQQVSLLRGWIDQGAKWDETVSFARAEPLNLKPRRPELPASRAKNANPIDVLLEKYFAEHKFKTPKLVDDRTYARRVYLDAIGLLPTPTELEKFVADKRADKREQLVRRLLADRQNYAVHWLTFWNDALRNDYKGTGYIDGGRTQITQWLYSALASNLPYDQFVTQLINPNAESEGFVKGIVWRGVVNASQTPQMQAAQNISQVFMGVNLKCASCHDSFINDWMLSDAYGLAGVYAEAPLEMVLCDKPTGKQAELRFIYPQLGKIDANADKAARLKQLAELICQPQDGRLTRTMVNRLWQRFFGQALVEPVDDMEKAAWHPDLLDWLAEDFAEHGYDVKHTIARILTSRAYQLPAVAAHEQTEQDYVFAGPTVRRLSAEQFRDALTALTGIGYSVPTAKINYRSGDASVTDAADKLPVTPKWIWNDPKAAAQAKTGSIFLRKDFFLPAVPSEAAVVVVGDNSFILYLNGKKVGEGNDFTKPYLFDVRSRLKKGTNFFSVKAVNALPGNVPPKDDEVGAGEDNPAGFLFYARLRERTNVLDFASDATWLWSRASQEWTQAEFTAAKWKPAVELGAVSMDPWKLEGQFVQKSLAGAQLGKVRAALVVADPLQVALGRPNREQVVTVRSSQATTLQALELTNGPQLAELLRRGAEQNLDELGGRDQIVQQLYFRALGRAPSAKETQLARELVGQPPHKDGVEDLMWSLTMLPEFQLIY